MAKLQTDKWTVVQHSAFGYKGDKTFQKGLEVRKIETDVQLGKVIDAGGVIFSDYASADAYENTHPYDGVEGLVPNAPGTFHKTLKIDKLAVYIPPAKKEA